MKTIRKLKWMLVIALMGWTSLGYAQYPGAPQITTSGSAAYTPIATAINSWKDAWTAGTNVSNNNNDAFTHRSTIIDQVEATLVAAGKATITDAEYDVLADALYFWLHRVADEGARQSNTGGHYNNRAGWYISGIGIPEHFFGKYSTTQDYNNSQCVWELVNPTCPIAGSGGNGYGPMLGSNTRMVLVTNQAECSIYRAHTKCNVMFSTNGENSKLLILGRKDHKITFNGGKNFSEPTSYNDVLGREGNLSSTTGNEVVINGGSLLAAYTKFHQNVATIDSCKYREYTKVRYDTVNEQGQLCGGTLVSPANGGGGAVTVTGKVNTISLYKTDIKNNAHNEKEISSFGGGMAIRLVSSIVDGIYMNGCSIVGNYTKGHGGGLSGYFDGGDSSEKMIIRNTVFNYNCQRGADERHGGGFFYRDTGRQTELYNCTFTNNYAHGATAGGAGISTEGHLLLQNCSFDRNYSDNAFGGAIYTRPVFDGSYSNKVVDLKIDGCEFTNNQCVWTHDNDSVNVSMQSSNIERGSGGAIMVDIFHGTSDAGSTTYDISVDIYGNSVFTNNTADRNGGAIAVVMMGDMKLWSATHANQITSNLKITSATINGNHVTDKDVPVFTYTSDAGSVQGVTKNGGAIYLAHTTLTMEGGTIGSQSAPNYATLGGGAYVNDANFYLKGGTLSYNNATTGGGAYIQTGSVEQSGGSISHNTSVDNGGGIYIANGSYKMTEADATSAVNDNTANANGGGIYVANGSVTVEQGAFDGNNAVMDGGGFYVTGNTSSVDITGGEIKNNSATQNGGGFAVEGGTVNISQTNTAYPTLITNNNATQNGGGFWVDVASTTDTTFITGGATVANNTAVNGGGAYINKGRLVIQDAATNLTSNTASTSGGGIYMAAGTVTFTNAKMQSNTATNNDGGGLYLGNGTITVSGANAAFTANKAKNRGGGVYVGGGSFTMTGGAIGGTTAQGNYTTSGAGYGGGLYMGGGTATLSGGTLGGNKAEGGYGGAIYMYGGTCTLSNGATIGGLPNGSLSYANSAKYGGGIYSAGGSITVKGGKIQYNTATTAGGGIYTNGADGVVNMEKQTSKAEMLSYIEYNTAEEGGGIYANRGVVNFSDGFIQYNHASEAGGGIYVNDNGGDDYGTLYLKGSANLRRNNVPTGHNGGGVYLKGKVVVGEQTANLGVIKAQENFAGDEYVYEWNDTGHPETDSIDQVTANNRNNIYLPDPGDPSVLTNHRDVITVIENGISLQSNVGFSVPHNYVPVIYCAPSSTSQDYLDQFSTGHEYQYMLFDDTRHYVAVHYPDRPEIFDRDHVYLYGFWANVVTGNEHDMECPISAADFEGQNPIEISNACELAFFISWVNGLNGLDTHADANAILLADIDMSKYGWVPIGDLTNGYSGTFDGNGHTVTGISSLLYREYLDYGFFGRLDGGTVKDLFVKDAFYALDNMPDLVIGGLVGEITTASTVENCEVSSRITATNSTTVVGGLIGRMNAGTVHSTIGISDMKGYLMGGLVGELLGGKLYNSFSNCKFTKAENHDKYMGGLAAVNRGTVENCYARLRGSAPTGNFGILLGDNTDGVVNYCYAPAGMTDYKVTGANPIGHGNYGESFLPYLYGHRDTQVSLANSSNSYVPTDASADKQMMVALNNWVDAKSTASVTYTKWGRPWQESNAHKPLNDDYPILKMPMAEAVGAKAGDPYLYYNPVDSLLVRYTDAESAIWLYRTPADVVRGDNSSSEAKLYIAEDVALKNLNELKAYGGITLDNSAGGHGANPTYGEMLGITTDATDWHMIATPLSDAHVGIDYQNDNTAYDFSWGHPAGMPYYLFYPKGNENNGYFPSHRFGESYPSSAATIEPGSYYNEWDFYSYDEPNYHWINFKRNKASHHYFDIETHPNLTYTNEELLVPGKGYFAATREETFLQCQGNLNADEVTYDLTQTSGVPRHGYNLIGNPYQAYLDFDAFADANWGDDVENIWGEGETPSYTILDEDAASYLTFAYDGSDNPDAAGRFIHPHQGFFVRTGLNGSMAYFQPDMRNTTARNSSFRGNDHIDYPLVNLFVSEANGNSDMVTVELGRPTQGGALLMQGLRAGNGKIWCHYNDVDYAVAYTQPGVTEAAIRFETVADTEYTMRWNTHNGDFSYLHLIDNVTGADVDCLTTDEYKFSASTSDYKSRFRLVFGYTGIEEDSEAETNENFAFIMNDELVVTGEGVLQVFDMTGRMVTSQELHGVQTTVSLPNAANGVYVLRLTEGKQSRIQKMVISK